MGINPGEYKLPDALDKEENYEKFSKHNRSKLGQAIRFIFDCGVCGKRFQDIKKVRKHQEEVHTRIMKEYTPKSYTEAVKNGKEENIKKHWSEHEYE